MSTNSGIHLLEKGKLVSIYCHYDGYLEGVGTTLFEHYQDVEKVRQLVKLGDISILGEIPNPTTSEHSFSSPEAGVTVAYGRDRGETGVEAQVRTLKPKNAESLIQFLVKRPYGEYEYVYHAGEKKWYFADVDTGESGLLSESLGLPEPKKQGVKKAKQKSVITREDSVKVARALRKKPTACYLLIKGDDGKLKGELLPLDKANLTSAVARFNWIEFGVEYQGKPTQAIFADYIYKKVNYEAGKQ